MILAGIVRAKEVIRLMSGQDLEFSVAMVVGFAIAVTIRKSWFFLACIMRQPIALLLLIVIAILFQLAMDQLFLS